MTNGLTIFLPRSSSSLRSVELLAVLDSSPGVPSYIAGAVVVRGMNGQGHLATEALAVDELDAAPLQQLRQLLVDNGPKPVLLDLVAQGDGRSSSRAWTLRGFGWANPKHLQDAGGAPDTLAIESFLAGALKAYMRAEAAV